MNTKQKKYYLKIGWLYPELMSTYGDRGNIMVLKKRCEWRGINTVILKIDPGQNEMPEDLDMVIGGGAQDRQQEIAVSDLRDFKKRSLEKLMVRGVPGLFVCGSPQLLGHYYITGNNKKIEGLGIFDYVTKHFGHDKPRCIGNTAGTVVGLPAGKAGCQLSAVSKRNTIVGFENHGGRTYLGKNCLPFAKVIRGFGNNGEDGTEGAVSNNFIACYYHGPFLSKNPHIADWLIFTALKISYSHEVSIETIDDTLEWKAHDMMLERMGIR